MSEALFTPFDIGSMRVPNRLVRSATADLAPWKLGRYTEEDVSLYRELAASGIGLIIAGGCEVLPQEACECGSLEDWAFSAERARVDGTDVLLRAIRETSAECKVIAQLECNAIISCQRPAGPSPITSPYYSGRFRELRAAEIEIMIDAFVQAIVLARDEGFDGVQLHAAHGGGLWHFLSPLGNQRTDEFGGSVDRRVRIIAETVRRARPVVGTFPILIKANCTDDVRGGIDAASFPDLAHALAAAGIDALEVSGGTWDALIRSEDELGFRPVPAAESHTGIHAPDRQNYYLPYVANLDLEIPLILVGGIRNSDAAERIVNQEHAQFVAMCRPLIREPRLVERWREGIGPSEAACIACNSCIYSMHLPFDKLGARTVTCLYDRSPQLHAEAQRWLSSFVDEIRADLSETC
jgi:2,4-dienoyl-CoA reductase-like NADH-dependent reductase (Old Yellow Enzyme family)